MKITTAQLVKLIQLVDVAVAVAKFTGDRETEKELHMLGEAIDIAEEVPS